jgi:hypothetical protein
VLFFQLGVLKKIEDSLTYLIKGGVTTASNTLQMRPELGIHLVSNSMGLPGTHRFQMIDSNDVIALTKGDDFWRVTVKIDCDSGII